MPSQYGGVSANKNRKVNSAFLTHCYKRKQNSHAGRFTRCFLSPCTAAILWAAPASISWVFLAVTPLAKCNVLYLFSNILSKILSDQLAKTITRPYLDAKHPRKPFTSLFLPSLKILSGKPFPLPPSHFKHIINSFASRPPNYCPSSQLWSCLFL